jgi:hypothetical protein
MTIRPLTAAIGLLGLSFACFIAGVFLLLGIGWALIAAAPPCFAGGLVILRGVLRASSRGAPRG